MSRVKQGEVLGQAECGCTVNNDYGTLWLQPLCALHASAGELLEACRQAYAYFEATDAPVGDVLREAIAHAEGRT